MPVAQRLFDADGAGLDDHWKGSPDACLGTGHSSAYMVLEAQLDYVAGAVRHFRSAGWDRMDVRPEVQAAFSAEVQQALPSTAARIECRPGRFCGAFGSGSGSTALRGGLGRRGLGGERAVRTPCREYDSMLRVECAGPALRRYGSGSCRLSGCRSPAVRPP